MDSERTVHGITWTDDLAWMEDMKGERWNTFVKKEQERWNHVKKSKLPKLKSQIHKASAIANQMRFTAGDLFIGHTGTMSYTWKWKGSRSEEVQEVADICVKGGCVYVSYEDSTTPGAENYVIAAYRMGSKSPLWERKGMSPFVGILGDRCYSIEAKNKLVYYKCVSWNCVRGDDVRVEYEEKDARYNLDLIRGEGCLYLRRQSGPKQDVINLLHNTLLQPVSLMSRRFVFGCVGEDEYLYWSSDEKWKASHGLKKYILPSFAKETPEYIDTRRHLLITRVYGKRTLWHISEGVPSIIWRGVGNLMVDPWEGDWLRITVPGVPVVWHDLKRWEIPKAVGLVQERVAKSADGTDVPFYIVSHVSRPKALFISAYSAYGIPTGFSTARWVPLLSEGFAVCFGIYRGGGDHTPEWEDAGRLGGRMKVLEDAEAVVREARRVCHIPASKTIIYGRSAGGLWVGGLCSRYPKGDLFGGAYMEVPYLDVLRTTTNLRLPLTLLETDDFGLPSLRISDFAGILQWSPMETLPPGGADIFQIVRTGLNDPQVFAYESAKWVERNRGKARVYLAIEGDQGHFVNGSMGLHQKAEDISFIIDFIKNRSN